MNLVELKCPNCGGSLELKENGLARCTFCGQIVALEDEPKTSININIVRDNKTNNTKSTSEVNANKVNTNKVNTNKVNTNKVNTNKANTFKTNTNKSTTKKANTNNSKTNIISTLKWVMLVIGGIILMFGDTIFDAFKNNNNIETDFDGLTNISGECNQLFLSDVFQKKYKSITQEEKNSIKYLRVDYEDGFFIYEYSFHDYSDYREYSNEEELRKTTKVWKIEKKDLPQSSDFTDFKGLTRLDCKLDISQIRFSEDCKLKYVTCSGSIKNLLKSVPVSQIEVLEISAYGETLDGIEEFNNLTSLTLKSRDLTDISKLEYCTNLKNLYISSDQLSDFGTLSKLRQLEGLTLSCNELRTLEFVESMEDLKSLHIFSGELYNVASLKGLINLKELSLNANFEVEDFEIIGTLTNLESLDVDENTENMDYLKELKNMKKLKIAELEDFSLLTPMKDLEELTIYYSGEYDNAYLLSENKKLRSLTINHGFGIDILDLSFLSEVKTLHEIKIYGNEFMPRRCRNLESALEIPSLETIKVCGFDVQMDLEHIKTNKSLKTLVLQTVSIVKMDPTGEEEEIEFSNSLEFVKHFPNLEVVTVKSSKLTSLEWVAHLINLRELDVSDNYISDFSVLNKLSKLERLDCSQNAKTNVKLDNDEVEIICIEN